MCTGKPGDAAQLPAVTTNESQSTESTLTQDAAQLPAVATNESQSTESTLTQDAGAIVAGLDHGDLQSAASVAGQQGVELVLGHAKLALLDLDEVLADVLEHLAGQLPLQAAETV